MLDEVIAGLKLYFNKALGTLLLYRHERQQYADARKRFPDTAMSDIYGCEHLLRLFGRFTWHAYCSLFALNHGIVFKVQLPMLIAQTTMDQESVILLKEQITGIVAYTSLTSFVVVTLLSNP
jgi:mortality factor 4-like protein 1